MTSALKGAGIIVVTEYLPSIEEYFHAADCYVFPTINQRAAIQVPLGVLEALDQACQLFLQTLAG